MWESTFEGEIIPNTGVSISVQVDGRLGNKSEYTSYDSAGPSEINQEAIKFSNKVQRRLAQNREAARKSRLRKKAYVQKLETYRLKLMQLEQELARTTRQQGLYIGGAQSTCHIGLSVHINSGITAFEMEYGLWVEEQQRLTCELRNVLQTHISDIELGVLVESGLNHYYNLFRLKADAAKSDVFYLMSGTWRTSIERFFHWLGGFRPSELLNVLMPQLEPFTEQQHLAFGNLRRSSQQAEDALSQGIDRLQQALAQSITADATDAGNYGFQMASAMEKLDALENFVNQADHLRQQTLHQMSRILTICQAARGLLALGEYFQRLRALSSLWATCPHETPCDI